MQPLQAQSSKEPSLWPVPNWRSLSLDGGFGASLEHPKASGGAHARCRFTLGLTDQFSSRRSSIPNSSEGVLDWAGSVLEGTASSGSVYWSCSSAEPGIGQRAPARFTAKVCAFATEWRQQVLAGKALHWESRGSWQRTSCWAERPESWKRTPEKDSEVLIGVDRHGEGVVMTTGEMGGPPEVRGRAGGPQLSGVKGPEPPGFAQLSGCRGPCLPLLSTVWPRPLPSGSWGHVPLGWELEVSGWEEGLLGGNYSSYSHLSPSPNSLPQLLHLEAFVWASDPSKYSVLHKGGGQTWLNRVCDTQNKMPEFRIVTWVDTDEM